MIGVRGPVIDIGLPSPLGATWDGKGVNFALFSEHAEKVELCLFDQRGRRELHRIVLPSYTDGIWHGYLSDARPGLRYGYRVYGPYEPALGHRFNPNKLLIDPYARSLSGTLRWSDANFGYRVGAPRGDLSFDRRDNASGMPKSVVVDTAFTWGDDRAPRTSWRDTVIYETHVRGFTMQYPGIPPTMRGTFLALSSPSVVEYLKRLGITAVELLPIHAFVDDRVLIEKTPATTIGAITASAFSHRTHSISRANRCTSSRRWSNNSTKPASKCSWTSFTTIRPKAIKRGRRSLSKASTTSRTIVWRKTRAFTTTRRGRATPSMSSIRAFCN